MPPGPEIKVRFLKFPDLDHLDQEHTLSEEEITAFESALIAVMVRTPAYGPSLERDAGMSSQTRCCNNVCLCKMTL